jgi:2,3-bisphosphoglycerate-independent phosphoglycerate mutase
MAHKSISPRPLALFILDGWGYREEREANAIAQARKPCWDFLWQHYPHTLVSGCGKCVGLPDGQMGNSEVGHMNMGAGRVIYQDFTRIEAAIEAKDFFSNPVLLSALNKAKNSALHIMGLLSPGGVHSHEQHIYALLELAAQRGITKVYLHAFLDGRDTPPRSALASLQGLQDKCRQLNCGEIVSIVGRYYAMDRDQRWERTQKVYDLITEGKANFQATDAIEALNQAYARNENDEFVQATCCHDYQGMKEDEVAIFMNFRADRARQLTQAFIDPNFKAFSREYKPRLNTFVTLTSYDSNFNIPAAFPPITLQRIFPEYLSELGLKQLRIAETEKYAHVTYFFNGGIEQAFPGEDRILIPSPKVATYDLQPEMSAYELTERLLKEIHQQQYDVIICNFANPDMVGHSGNFAATIKAIETIDACLNKLLAALKQVGGEAIITADHGNAEMMFDSATQQPHTAHTHEKVPAIYIGRPAIVAHSEGVLADIAPTLLYLMGIPQPPEMTGKPLFTLK